MTNPVIRVENLSKEYRLGEIGTGVFFRDLHRWWNRARGKPDPFAVIRQNYIDSATPPEPEHSAATIHALREVSFEVFQGEVVGVIGRNGAGKSTLLKILSRVTAPTSGSIRMKGRLASLLEVGTGFHPELTGRENIFLNGAILGMSKSDIRQHLDEIIDFSGCSQFIDTPVRRYSSGMYVRLAFAVAAHLSSDILVVDEVLAVGDLEFQKKCIDRMGEVAKEGRTVLVVSHNMASITNLCTRALLVNRGRLLADGSVGDVIPQYLNSGVESGGLFHQPVEDAPGNELVRLRRVEITQDGIEGPCSDVDIARDVIIRITYESLQDDLPLYAGLWLKDALGTAVLCSGNAPDFNSLDDPWWGRPHPCGVYVSETRLPGNFLNYGRYRVTPIVGLTPTNTQILIEDLVSFDVHDTGSMRKTYYGSRLGVVHPPLPWVTRRAASDDTVSTQIQPFPIA